MSRSRKKAIIKDRGCKKTYWRTIRSRWKNFIKSTDNIEEIEFPNEKTIINDYDYCDYIIDYEHDNRNREFWLNGIKYEDSIYPIKATRK